MNTPSLADTSAVANQLARLITASTTEQTLLSVELSELLQVAQAQAERKALRPH